MKLYYFYLFIMRYLFYFLHLVGSNRTLDTFCQNESKNNNKKAILLLDENLTDDGNSVFVAESLPKNWRLRKFKNSQIQSKVDLIWSQIRSDQKINFLVILIWSQIIFQTIDLDLISDHFFGWSDLKWSEIFQIMKFFLIVL